MSARRGPVAARLACAALLAVAAAPALAHHGSASASALGAEGPGAAIDTTSPLPLGQGTLLGLLKSEYVPFQQRAGSTEQKRYALFDTAAVGYGLTPWLTFFLFQPFNAKSQQGLGTNTGLGDTNLMLSASFKWDDGFQRVPEKESLDDLVDWHFGAWASCTLPLGPTSHRDALGGFFAPDMQTGFNGPSPAFGVSILKQLSADLTALAAADLQHFLERRYPQAGLRYRFGDETRLSGALVQRLWAGGGRRIDVAPELQLLDLQRDRSDQGTGVVVPRPASGGTVLYAQLGARATLGPFAVAASVKRAVARALHEGAAQQGSEGLEDYRAAIILSFVPRR